MSDTTPPHGPDGPPGDSNGDPHGDLADVEVLYPDTEDDDFAEDAEIVDIHASHSPPPDDAGPHGLGPHDLGLELPDDPAAAQALLLRELLEARQEASEYLETLQRIAADFENYRRRVERDQTENVLRASQRIVEAMLPTLDAFDAALAYEAQDEGESKLLDGMRGTYTQLMDTLGREGLAAIDATVGEPFDPAVHEAVAGGGDGHLIVAAELRRGYRLRDRLLRPAMVSVEAGS